MTEGWGMVVAAAIALAGVLCGLFVGRRQVRDQAQVEHGQWLRGQRQEAYVRFIAAWDEGIPKFEARILTDEDDRWIGSMDESMEEIGDMAATTMHKEQEPLRAAAERVQMLGPEEVEDAVSGMLNTVDDLIMGIVAQYAEGNRDNLASYWEAMGQTGPRRATFVSAAQGVLRTAPDTGRRWFR
ncbi:hypothetical protein [Streptomyces amritsarensis]|uniref:hypothetical protein n=1 Tax=Streptomyces amritsarensis TaxID=681158 RepID=UPI00368501D9